MRRKSHLLALTLFAALSMGGGEQPPATTELDFGQLCFFHQAAFHRGNLYRMGGNELRNTVLRHPVVNGVPAPCGVKESSLPENTGTTSPAIVLSGDRLYLMGGMIQCQGKRDVETGNVFFATVKPDGSLSAWRQTSSLPDTVHGGMAASHDGVIHYVGGYMKRRAFMAKPSDDGEISAWRETPPLPSTAYAGGLVVMNGYLYANGSPLHATGSEKVYYACIAPDGTPEKWRRTTNLPVKGQGILAEGKGALLYFDGKGGKVFLSRQEDKGQLGDWWEAATLPVSNVLGFTITQLPQGYLYLGGLTWDKPPSFPKSHMIQIEESQP